MTEDSVPTLRIESSPPQVYVGVYERLPYPNLGPMQEFVFEVGITSNVNAVVTDAVWRVFAGDDVVAVRQRLGESFAVLTGGERGVAPGLGLALRRCYFLEPGMQRMTHVKVSIHGFVHDTRQLLTANVDVPLAYHEQKARLRLPFAAGAWWAIMGNDWTDLHKAEPVSQPFAYDFVKLGPEGRFFQDNGLENEDHYCFGQPVVAPAGGKVVFCRDGMPDNKPGQPPDPQVLEGDPRRITGNCVVISHGHGECSYLAHLQEGSIQVEEGQAVRRSQVLGCVGNSGASHGPHLHYHLQSGPNLFVDQGLPVTFHHFCMAGEPVDGSSIPSRAIVSPA